MELNKKTEILEPKTPYRVFREITKGENRNPSSISEATGIDKGNVSSVLSALKKQEIVKSEKDGRKRLYYIDWDNFYADWQLSVKKKVAETEAKEEELVKGRKADISREVPSKYLSEFERNPRVKDVFKWHIKNYVKSKEDSNLQSMLYKDFLYVLKDAPRTKDEELNQAIAATEEILDYATALKQELNYSQTIVSVEET